MFFFVIIDTVPTGGQVYVVVIPGGFGARLGVKLKNFLGSLTLAITPCTNQLIFTLYYNTWHVSLTDKVIYLGI